MLDLTNTRHRIIAASLRLAETHGWTGLSLDRIANEAGMTLAALSREFSGKSRILAAFGRAADDAVLARVTPADAELAARDRLFDVLMTRFEIMAPYKAGLKRIRDDLRLQPGLVLVQLCNATRSVYWMLAAAGIDAEGSRGTLRMPGMMALYARVFDIWLDDDDPGLARTMAALDSRLRRGERIMQRIDDLGAAASSLCARLWPSRDGGAGREPGGYEPAPPHPSPEPGASNGSGGAGPAPAM